VERRGSDIDSATLQRDMEGSLKTALNVRVGVEVVEPGALTEFTRLGGEGKVRRLLDLRRK